LILITSGESALGRLIAISGLDGAGKTTLAHALLGHLIDVRLKAEGLEMGPSRVWRWAEVLTDRIPSFGADIAGDRIGLALNFERFGFVMDHVLPALSVCEYIVLQRFVLDWAASGRGFGASESEVAMIQTFTEIIAIPTITIYLDITPELAAARIRARGRSSDPREEKAALIRTARAYEELLGQFPGVVRIDATLPTSQQVEIVLAALEIPAGFAAKPPRL
jgi:dTMP kinase